jgi:hypothetical protein
VAGSGGSIAFDVSVQRGWLVFTIDNRPRITLTASFALTRNRSYISRTAQDDLASVQRFLRRREPDFSFMATVEPGSAYTLLGFQIEDQPIGGLDVRVSGALARAPFDILLGLDFLRRYASICFDPHASRISFEPPTT